MRPFTLELKIGERKSLCTCDKSSVLPFCDGAHRGSGKTPFTVHFKDSQTVVISGTTCGQAGSLPNAFPKKCCREESSAPSQSLVTKNKGCCRQMPNEEP